MWLHKLPQNLSVFDLAASFRTFKKLISIRTAEPMSQQIYVIFQIYYYRKAYCTLACMAMYILRQQ